MPMTYTSNDLNSFNENTQKTASAISNEFHNFLQDVEDLFKSTTSMTSDDLAKVKAKLNTRIEAAKEVVGDVSDDLAYKARRTAAITNHYVHEQPWTVIGAGAAVSFLIGFLLARRA